MFKTIRDKLAGNIEENKTLVSVEGKLKSFLDQNPDVDHYISDHNRSRYSANFWLGVVIGSLLVLLVTLIVIMCVFNMWHELGYLKVPYLQGWS
jgi:hypothetical protein